MANGRLSELPAGLRGMLAAEQMNQQRSQNQLGQIGGILSLQGAAQTQAIQQQGLLEKQQQQERLSQFASSLPEGERQRFMVAPAEYIKQLGKGNEAFARINPKDYTPESVARFSQTKSHADLVPVRNLSFQNTGGAIVGLDPITGQPASPPMATTATPHQLWTQNTQFPLQYGVDRARLGNDSARLMWETGQPGAIPPPMVGGNGPRMGGSQIPVARAASPALGVPPPRDAAPMQPQNIVPGGQQGAPSPLPPKMAAEIAASKLKGDTSDVERTSSGYATRMLSSGQLINELEAKGVGAPEVTEAALSNVPVAGKMLSNVSMSPDRQKYRQAQEDWVRAKLRKESGAVIADEEMDREIRVYFPQIGDSDAVKLQKADSRKTAEEAMVQSAGKATPTRPQRRASDIEAQVKALGQTYEPNVYDYRIVNGEVQRKKK